MLRFGIWLQKFLYASPIIQTYQLMVEGLYSHQYLSPEEHDVCWFLNSTYDDGKICHGFLVLGRRLTGMLLQSEGQIRLSVCFFFFFFKKTLGCHSLIVYPIKEILDRCRLFNNNNTYDSTHLTLANIWLLSIIHTFTLLADHHNLLKST